MFDISSPSRGPGTNTGHGHVWPRPDGLKARCGGPNMCRRCVEDAARWDVEQLLDELAGVIRSVEHNWDREGSGSGSRFAGELREHAQARGVVNWLISMRLLGGDGDG